MSMPSGPAEFGSTTAYHGPSSANPARVAYLQLRAERARRRLIISIVLLVFTAALWSYRLIPGFSYPWWYALVPTALLLAVLVSGRLAARAAAANDQRYFANLRAGQRQGGALGYGPVVANDDWFAGELPVVQAVLSVDEEYFDDDLDYDPDFDLPYVNDEVVLPVPPTQLIPEAAQRRVVENNLKDDPEFTTASARKRQRALSGLA